MHACMHALDMYMYMSWMRCPEREGKDRGGGVRGHSEPFIEGHGERNTGKDGRAKIEKSCAKCCPALDGNSEIRTYGTMHIWYF